MMSGSMDSDAAVFRSELFPDDLIADYFQSAASPGIPPSID